jgi:hypothetical protein
MLMELSYRLGTFLRVLPLQRCIDLESTVVTIAHRGI